MPPLTDFTRLRAYNPLAMNTVLSVDLRFYFFQSSIVNLILLKWYGEDDQNIITASDSESTTASGKDANLKEEELKKKWSMHWIL